MLIPIDDVSFQRDFLNGQGSLDIDANGFDPGQPLPNNITQLAVVSAGANPAALEFGSPAGLACAVNFQAKEKSGIELIWPGQTNDFTKQRNIAQVPAGKVGAHLFFDASASGNVADTMPVGPASFEFGIKAGAGVGYDRYFVYDDHTLGGTLVKDLVTGLRLPQNCGAIDRLPLPGEVLCFDYNGFLDLSAGLSWGYQLSGTHDIDFNNLDLAIDYQLRLKAAVSVGYKLGGEFSMEVSRGHGLGWVHVVVRKQRTSEFDFAASFNADADIQLTGLPSSADDFLSALLGTDVKTALSLFDKIKDYTDSSKIDQEAGKLLAGRLQNLAHKWIGEALDQSTMAKFLSVVNKVITDYENADQVVVNTVTHLYEDYLSHGKVDVLKAAVTKIAALKGRDGLATLSDPDAWSVIHTLIGGDIFKLLQENIVFAQIMGLAQKTLDFMNGSWQPGLKDLIDELKSAFQLNKVFSEISQFCAKEKLPNLPDEKLQGVVEKLLNKTWDEIKTSSAADFAKQVEGVLVKIDKFKDTWYLCLKKAANQSFSLQLNYSYTRASENDTLIDVDIDLSTAAGAALFDDAVHGKFKSVFANPNSPLIQVHQGVLTHSLTKTTQLQIAVFGWQASSFTQVVSNTEIAIQAGPSGQIQVFTTQSSIDQRKSTQTKKGSDKITETVETNFLLKFVGETFLPTSSPAAPYLVRAINNMAAEYDLSYTDDQTTGTELQSYLAFAEALGLIPSAQAFTQALVAQFPNGLNKVTAKYVVAFDNDGVRDAFTVTPGQAKALAHRITQGLIRSALIHRGLLVGPALIALAAIDPQIHRVYEQQGFTAVRDGHWAVNVPADLGGGRTNINQALNPFINTLLGMEFAFAQSFSDLDDLVTKAKHGTPIPVDTLQKMVTKFVESAADISSYGRINSVFAVFDALVRAGSNGKGYRESTMILEIQAGTQTVTKFLSSGAPKELTAAALAACGNP